MGKVFETICGIVTAPAGVQTPLVLTPPDSLVVRSAKEGGKNYLLNAWVMNQGAGQFRMRSALMHDAINNMRYDIQVALPDLLLALGCPQPIIAEDTILADLSGSAVGGAIEQAFLMMFYDDIAGADQRLISPADLKGKIKNILTMRNVITPLAIGSWSGAAAINATEDRFKGNTDYAILGYIVDVPGGGVRYRGPDVSNIGVGGICNPAYRDQTVNWFVWLSEKYGLPLIPIVNSSNKAATFVEVAQDDGAAVVTIDTIYAELSK